MINKVYCLGTDGAESMVSANVGVASYFRNVNPFSLNIHCWLHRLALSNKDITKEIHYLKEVIHIITGFFIKFFIKDKSCSKRI